MSVQQPQRRAGAEWTPSSAIEKANQVDDWIAINEDGTVTVFSGRVELGTGVETALAQIVADELDVPFDRIKMVMGDTEITPDEGYTAGSRTIQFGGFALRHASAEARRALLQMASDQLDATLDELGVRDGVVSVTHHPDRSISYSELLGGKKFNRAITMTAPIKRHDEYRVVGKPLQRVDLPRKFTGAPSFVQDIRVPGMLHARVVRPPSPGARLIAVDENSVRDAHLVRIGNFVGVVAEREESAVHAAKGLKTMWEEAPRLPPMENFADYLRAQPSTDKIVSELGKVEDALERATRVASALYYHPYQAHASIGPSCAVADYREDHLTIWCSSQGVFPLRGALADLLQLPSEKIQVIHVEGAGCYGHNGFDDVAADAAVLSRAMKQPVRVQWTREDEFGWEPYAPAMAFKLRGGVNVDGKIVAWDFQAWSPTHQNRPRAGIQLLAAQLIAGNMPPPSGFFFGGDRNAQTNYSIANNRVTMHWLAQSPLRVSAFRSLGAVANTFANESFVDELAHAAHVDPVEFRMRHLEDPRAIDVLKSVAEAAGWGTPLEHGEGRGVAFARYENDAAYVACIAQVSVEASGEGRLQKVFIAHDCGLIVNPNGTKNQVEGSVIQSASRALKEQVTWDPLGSRITSLNWETYPILKFSEVPEVEVVLINRTDQPSFGAGEPAAIVSAPAIANAIFAACGARVREIPFTAKHVRAAMKL